VKSRVNPLNPSGDPALTGLCLSNMTYLGPLAMPTTNILSNPKEYLFY